LQPYSGVPEGRGVKNETGESGKDKPLKRGRGKVKVVITNIDGSLVKGSPKEDRKNFSGKSRKR
jgi:hypothetical protein